jgi:cytochrome c oxidase subunit III
MSITAIQKGQKNLAMALNVFTVLMAMVFMINKYFEWTHKFHLHLWPGSTVVRTEIPRGELLFISLYFIMTGLHALHVLIGATLIIICIFRIKVGAVNKDRFLFLENSGLYWHLVDLIWIFLFPLLYLIT